MAFGSLFAGIGGFDLGLERAGMECKWQVELDDFCNKVLEKHWPNVPRYEDVRKVHGNVAHAPGYDGRNDCLKSSDTESLEWGTGRAGSRCLQVGTIGGIKRDTGEPPCPSCLPPVDLICGGFPCQPFSVAGKQRGKEDDRHLWPEMFRVVSELRPRWVLGENVPGLVRLGLDEVLSDLEGIGYSCQTFDIPACAVDAPHVRHRIWIVAHTERDGWGSRRTECEGQPRRVASFGASGEDVADTEDKRCEYPIDGAGGEIGGRRGYSIPVTGIRWPDEGEWFAESGIRRVSHGVPQRVDRLRSLGNAVVVPLVTQIGRMIVECER